MTYKTLLNLPVTTGSNQIVGTDTQKILDAYKNAISGNWREPQIPPLWDGNAAKRIVKIISERSSQF